MKRLRRLCVLVVIGLVPAWSSTSSAEVTVFSSDTFGEIYLDGRIGGFFSYTNGDARPNNTVIGTDQGSEEVHNVVGGGLEAYRERAPTDPDAKIPVGEIRQLPQGKLDSARIRSGFLSNVFGVGMRRQVTPNLKMETYMALWAFIETEARRKYRPVYPDMRVGYVKLIGSWGSILVGRNRALFSRGAGTIDFLYGHGYGVGYPGDIDSNGPTAGHIGFGVLSPGYAAGIVYATPVLGGLQLSVGAFDPAQLAGAWERTGMVRPEFELTFERPISDIGKFVLFGNGAYQKLYKPDELTSTYAAGFGYGGRLELGPVRLGVAGHYGRGLGLSYALENSPAAYTDTFQLRKFDGYYAQSQIVIGNLNLCAGWGITRVYLVEPEDNLGHTDPATGNPDPAKEYLGPIHSVIKHQMGISAAVVYHVSPSLHVDVDYFRAAFAWYLGEKQNVNFIHAGLTSTW